MLKTGGHVKMLVAVVLFSIFAGLAAVGASLLFDVSLWTTLLAYPMGAVSGFSLQPRLPALCPIAWSVSQRPLPDLPDARKGPAFRSLGNFPLERAPCNKPRSAVKLHQFLHLP